MYYYQLSELTNKEYEGDKLCIVFSGKKQQNIIDIIAKEKPESDLLIIELEAKDKPTADKAKKAVFDFYLEYMPDRVLLVGTLAMKSFLGDRYEEIDHSHGALIVGSYGEVFVSTYDKVDMVKKKYRENDIKRFLRYDIPDISKEYEEVDSIKPLEYRVREGSIIYLDIETTGLDWQSDTITSLQIAIDNSKVFYYTEPSRELLISLYNLCKEFNCIIVAHNAMFDVSVLCARTGKPWYNLTLHDTMLLVKARGSSNNSLKHLASITGTLHPLSYSDYKGAFNKEYAIVDILCTREIYQKVTAKGLKPIDILSSDTLSAFIKSRLYGIKLDSEEIAKQVIELQANIDRAEEVIASATNGINYQSNDSLVKWLLGEGIKLTEKTATGKFSVSEGVLQSISSGKELTDIDIDNLKASDIVSLILYVRKSKKLLKTFYKAYENKEFLHPTMNTLGADTGRTTSTNPNIQNVPSYVRRVFVSRFEGGKIASFDIDRNELVCAAVLSGDRAMIEALLQYDYHTYVASAAFNIPYDEVPKDKRQIAKIVTFGALLYGGSAYGIGKRVGVEPEIIQKAVDNVQSKFTSLTKYQKQQIAYAERNVRVVDCMGKVRDLRKVLQYGKPGAVKRDAMNTPVQGFGGYICLLLYTYIHKEIERLGLQSLLIFQIHDEVIIDVHPDEVEIIKRLKEEAFAYVLEHPVIKSLPGYGLIKWTGDMSFGNNVYEAKGD